ncbi:MAG: DUF427 domain-containing protein [Rubrobacteraceae bacterium]
MALAVGTGPFGKQGGGAFNFEVDAPKGHTLYFEDSPRRVRAVFGGETVAESDNVKMLHETGYLPTYYFPIEDTNQDLLETTDHTTHCPFKGDAAYWSVRAGGEVAENAVWGYPEPLESSPIPENYVAIYFGAMDQWFEEDEEITVHPRDPYHRVDVRAGSRHVKVTVNGEAVAESDHPKILFETGLPPRYYLPPEDVNQDLLSPSETVTHCPYKGAASYWSAEINGETIEDVAWSYPDPLPEAAKAEGHYCFLGEDVETEVDGEPV